MAAFAAKLLRIELRETAAEPESVEVAGQLRLAQRRKADRLDAELPQKIEVLAIVEIESFVAGHAEAQLRLRRGFAPARPGLRQRFAGQLKKPVKVDGSPDRIAEQVEP